MITSPGFGIYVNDDYPEPDCLSGSRPLAVFTGTSPVEQALLAGLPSVQPPQPASSRGIYLFGPRISCPGRWPNGAAFLTCPLDGAQCLFFRPARRGQRARIDSPKRWAFLLDLVHQRHWVHPGPPCLEGRPDLCDGLVPTCRPFLGVSPAAVEEGYQPFGCKAYGACWERWRLAKAFPACIHASIDKDRGDSFGR